MEFPRRAGIYQITHLSSGESYVGAAANLNSRLRGHLSQIRNESHPSPLIHEKFSPYVESEISVTVLEQCEVSKLGERESYWISNLRPSLNAGGGRHRSKVRHPGGTVDVFARLSADTVDKFDEIVAGFKPATSRSAVIAMVLEQYVEQQWKSHKKG